MLKKIFSWSNIPIIVILCLASYFRLKGLSGRDIWYDEVLTVLQSEKSYLQILKDVPTPVHYFFVKAFLFIGKSTFILGLPSVIFGLLTVYLTYRVGKKVFSNQLGLVAAFLVAISPMLIEFSQQILFFSYYTFFSLLSLYFLIKFIASFDEKKISWKSLVLCGFVAWINVLTQMVGIIVALQEIIFLSIFLLLKSNAWIRRPKMKSIGLLGVVIIVLFLVVSVIGGGGYRRLLTNEVKVDFTKPITVGWSLSGQLHSTVLRFDKDFFIAMFSWFGLSGGVRFYLYLILFILGVTYFICYIKPKYTFLFLVWIVFPFLALFLIRINHWFEEKYFIFVIPVYLTFIAAGILQITSLIRSALERVRLTKSVSVLLSLLTPATLSIAILLLALSPIGHRTSFGFDFPGNVTYSWRKVYQYLISNINEGDRVWLSKNGTLFLDYYFGANKNDFIFDEVKVARSSQIEYESLVNTKARNIFVSIPDFNDLFLAGATNYKATTIIGGFNIYNIKFIKQDPIVIKPKSAEIWRFYDDFRTGSYLSQTVDRVNIMTSYSDFNTMPKHEGFNVLSPISFENSSITYHFSFPKTPDKIFLKPLFSIDGGVAFQVYAGTSKDDLKKVYEKSANQFAFFDDNLKIPSVNESLYIKFQFVYKKGIKHAIGGAQLKSFLLTNDAGSGITSNDYIISLSGDLKREYKYDSELEVVRSYKWFYQSSASKGWLQTNEGFLIKGYGDDNTNLPLIYKFNLSDTITEAKIDVKAFAHYTNPIYIEYSKNGITWHRLAHVNDNQQKIYQFDIKDVNADVLYLRFYAKLDDPSSQIRNFQLTFK